MLSLQTISVPYTVDTGDTMERAVSTMTSKGQITLPAAIRRSLGLKRGDKVVFQMEEEGVKLMPARSALAAGYQSIPPLKTPKTWKEIEEIVRDEQARAVVEKDR